MTSKDKPAFPSNEMDLLRVMPNTPTNRALHELEAAIGYAIRKDATNVAESFVTMYEDQIRQGLQLLLQKEAHDKEGK